ncbi:hypothetical protein NLJ89_g5160 [Agrocybe chaxingu]|uniref:Uncharacterized protein n=1 Tax=Agrocybe chaxingu TaxID=84603 RepID=A0A9W8K7Q6_9AGAR|nr:hypothetical protein NLJ89_g5160 [Agrocybe chaxingu]
MLGSPIALSTPLHPPPSSANRVMASPVVGEFKGWFSNLFGWKNSSANGGILYSSDDIHRTHLHVARILEGLGIVLANHPSEAHPTSEQTQSEVLFCRVDQPTVDPASGISLKNVRFRVEFRAGYSASPDPQPSAHPVGGSGEDPSYLLTAPPQTPNYAMTPTSAGPGVTGSSRPRGSMLLGRSVSHGTPLPSPMPTMAKWDFPPGCLCAVALVHEKGSMSTFRAVWRRLKDEYGDSSTAYPCFSPAIPGTPYTESQRMVV